jgi:hypothetical protein
MTRTDVPDPENHKITFSTLLGDALQKMQFLELWLPISNPPGPPMGKPAGMPGLGPMFPTVFTCASKPVLVKRNQRHCA